MREKLTIRPLLLLSLLYLSGTAATYGQSAPRNVPFYTPQAAAGREKLADQVRASIAEHFQPPARFDKKAKEDYTGRRNQLAEQVSSEIAELAVVDEPLWAFLKSTLAKIAAANPEAQPARVLLVANPTPNAFSVGEGTLVVHTGLLAGLENEDQLAFVLCHELAHWLLRHSTHRLETDVEQFNSKAFQAKIKALEAVEYNRSEQMEAVLKGLVLNARYHSRDKERQADSLAYRLFVKTSFEHPQALRLMRLFEWMDEPLRDTILQLPTQFGCVQYPFQNQWITQKSTSVWADAYAAQKAANEALRDSLSTHPDSKNRLLWLAALANLPVAGSADTPGKPGTYGTVQYLGALENVEAWARAERCDEVLFLAAKYERLYPECQYFREMQAWALVELYAHLKAHDLASVLEQSTPGYTEEYNQFLDLLNNLRMKDLLGLANCQLARLPADKGEHGLLAAYLLANAQEDRSAAAAVRKEYQTRFRNGQFADVFKNK